MTSSRPYRTRARRSPWPITFRLRWAAHDLVFGLLCASVVVYVGLLCIEQHLALVRTSAALAALVLMPYGIVQRIRRLRARRRAERLAAALAVAAPGLFAIRPCYRCYDERFDILQVGYLARSAQYACATCGRTAWAAATAAAAAELWQLWCEMTAAAELYRRLSGRADYVVHARGAAPLPALPYEATRRESIAADVRRHVWARDGGACVQCGSTESLELDHVLPVARGGATTVANLQVLCRGCNARKGVSV